MAFAIQIGKKRLELSKKGLFLGDMPSEYPNPAEFFTIKDVALDGILAGITTGPHSLRNMIELFHSVAEIYAPIDEIAKRVAAGNFQVKRIEDDEIVWDNVALNKLLEHPNPLQNFAELVYELVCYELVCGMNFLYTRVPNTLSYDYRNISTLWNLWADQVNIVPVKNANLYSATEITDLISRYEVSNTAGKYEIAPDRVLYTKAQNLAKGYSITGSRGHLYGISPLFSASKAIANLIPVYEARGAIYTKRGALGMIVSRATDQGGIVPLAPHEKERLRREYNATYGITGNRSTVGITDQPIDFIRIGMSIDELKPFEETLADASAIYAALNVPRELMPRQEGATFENQNQAEKRLYQNTCIPRAKSLAQSLSNAWKLREAGLYIDVDFSHIAILQEDKKAQSEVFRNNKDSYVSLYEKGLITKDAVLIGMGFEAMADGSGDVYITDQKNDAPLAVRLGVAGTQALQSVMSDTALSEDAKAAALVILFGLTEEQARTLSTPAAANAANNNNASKPDKQETERTDQ